MSEHQPDGTHEEKLENILQSNHYIRHRVQRSVNEFLQMRQNLLRQLQTKKLNDISKELAPLIDAMRIETLNQEVTSEKVQLALCGENSSGKTSFIHLLLGIGDILPSDVGPITARIVKMTYAKAEEACAIVYSSLEASLNKTNGVRIDLARFFVLHTEDDEPDWNGISDSLADQVKRPEGMDIKSEKFAEWAKHFIEIRLPSPTLKIGIDVYDTAGFRVLDAQILKDCLHDLVRLVHPTLVFLYDNPSSTDETNDCFLALTKTLKPLDSPNMFFLNTKADIDKMPGINKIKTVKQFNDFLNNERIKRYDLLLKTPGMTNGTRERLPKSFDKCNCFDMCSVNSQIIRPFGPIMNDTATQRLIQFVANSDLIMAQRVSSLVLPAIESFFNLALITSHRTKDQLKQLRNDAQQWIENYFQKHREKLNEFLRDIFQKILERLSLIKSDLARRAAQQKDLTNIKTFIQLALNQEVMKGVVYDTLGSMSEALLELISSKHDLMINATSNDILIAALGIDINNRIEIINEESTNADTLRSFMTQTFTTPILMVTDLLFNEGSHESTNNLLAYAKYRQFESDDFEMVSFNPLQEANQYLIEIHNQIITSEAMFLTTILTWCSQQKIKLQKQISQQYETVIKLLPDRDRAHDILQQYAHQFVRIECQLQAAQDLAKFNGKKPLIRCPTIHHSPSPTTVYTIHEIEWGSKNKNLFVKRLTRPIPSQPDTTYLEAHYHRKITNLNIPHVIKLTYLYENRLPDDSYELWMIFERQPPGLKRNLNHFLDEHHQHQTFISLKKLLQIILPIIHALAALHENELVHRNLIASNILLDDQDQSSLADLGDWNLSNNETPIDIQLRHQISITSAAGNDDLKAFGQIAFMLCTIINQEETSSTIFHEYKQLIETSLKATSKATEIRHKLKYFYDKLNHSLQ